MEENINGELVPQGGGDSIPLVRSPLVLGRRESCDICLQFPNVSGKHCELIFKEGFWLIQDLDSTNGTKVNGMRVHKKVLRTGDVITIAKRSYAIQYTESGSSSSLDEFEHEVEEAMNMSLLEKSGLAKPQPRGPKDTPRPPKPLGTLIGNEEEDDDE
jgi:adenylate cyclase